MGILCMLVLFQVFFSGEPVMLGTSCRTKKGAQILLLMDVSHCS